MRLLLFSDLHRDQVAATALVEKAADADLVIGAGDFATCRQGVEDCLEILQRIACPAILVPGNGESFAELQSACQNWSQAHVLHGSGVRLRGVDFFGIGGGIPVTPFGAWSWDFTEAEAEPLLADCPPQAVLVSHSPPQGLVDIDSDGEHRGSQTIRQAIERFSLKLIVCGHIHDSWEQQQTAGQTIVINAGPRGVWFDLPD